MNRLKDLSWRMILFWLTDRRRKPPQYLRIWGFLVFGASLIFVIAQSQNVGLLMYFALVMLTAWMILTLLYLFWVIQRGLRFVSFKRSTQRKEQSFEVPLISSDRKLKP